MRRRRAERLALRADVALTAGYLDEAQACIEEGRNLAPSLAAFAEIEQKLRETSVVSAFIRKLVFRFSYQISSQKIPRRARILATSTAALCIAAAAAIGQGGARPIVPTREFRSTAILVGADRRVPRPVRQTAKPFRSKAEAFPQRTDSFRSKGDAARAGSAVRRTSDPPVEGAIAGWVREIALEASAAATPKPERTLARVPAAPVVTPSETPAAIPVPALGASVSGGPSDDLLVRTALDRYAAAYSALDAGAAERVWPRVNRAALSRAFENLASQRVSLGSCRIDVAGAKARASCAGSATWAPKVGGGSSRTDSRQWDFELARTGGGWQILDARVQNR